MRSRACFFSWSRFVCRRSDRHAALASEVSPLARAAETRGDLFSKRGRARAAKGTRLLRPFSSFSRTLPKRPAPASSERGREREREALCGLSSAQVDYDATPEELQAHFASRVPPSRGRYVCPSFFQLVARRECDFFSSARAFPLLPGTTLHSTPGGALFHCEKRSGTFETLCRERRSSWREGFRGVKPLRETSSAKGFRTGTRPFEENTLKRRCGTINRVTILCDKSTAWPACAVEL